MKKRNLAGLLLLAPLVLLSACGGVPELEITTKWNRDVTLGNNVDGTSETLEYRVEYQAPEEKGDFSVAYTNGVYTSGYTVESIKTEKGNEKGYILRTSLEIDVQFFYREQQTAVMHDVTTSEVQFLLVGDKLRPIRSTKSVHENVPFRNVNSIKDCYGEYDYEFAIEYDSDDSTITKADVTFTDRSSDGGEPVKNEYPVKGKGTFLDNEEILFALRGMKYSEGLSFRTFNTTMKNVSTVALRSVQETEQAISFKLDGENSLVPLSEGEEGAIIPVYQIELSLGGNIGQSRTVVIAKQNDKGSENVYHCVPVSIYSPLLYSLGELRFTLQRATFTK